jgi:Recombination endonuclease VII
LRELIQRTEKKCAACKQVLPVSEFHKAGKYLQGKCKTCVGAFVAGWKAANRDKTRANQAAYQRRWMARKPLAERSAKYRKDDLSRHYGMSVVEYDFQFAKQGGVCAICKMPCPSGRRLAVDHDHETEQRRGLLCAPCNTAIARMDAIPNWAVAATIYLEEYKMAKEDIYGRNPDGGAKAAAEEALRRMGSLSVTDKATESDGPSVSDSSDLVKDRAEP